MRFLIYLLAFKLCILPLESKIRLKGDTSENESEDDDERTARLIVLPPLIIGYDELYTDSNEEPKELKKTTKNTGSKEIIYNHHNSQNDAENTKEPEDKKSNQPSKENESRDTLIQKQYSITEPNEEYEDDGVKETDKKIKYQESDQKTMVEDKEPTVLSQTNNAEKKSNIRKRKRQP